MIENATANTEKKRSLRRSSCLYRSWFHTSSSVPCGLVTVGLDTVTSSRSTWSEGCAHAGEARIRRIERAVDVLVGVGRREEPVVPGVDERPGPSGGGRPQVGLA